MFEYTDEKLEQYSALAVKNQSKYGAWTRICFAIVIGGLFGTSIACWVGMYMTYWYFPSIKSDTWLSIVFPWLSMPTACLFYFLYKDFYWQREEHCADILLEIRKQGRAQQKEKGDVI